VTHHRELRRFLLPAFLPLVCRPSVVSLTGLLSLPTACDLGAPAVSGKVNNSGDAGGELALSEKTTNSPSQVTEMLGSGLLMTTHVLKKSFCLATTEPLRVT
jgi:hypothetical protein